jgi:hypothetical protein
MREEIRCINQVFARSKRKHDLEGWGDCSICIPDDKNKECKGYVPVKIRYFIATGYAERKITPL